MPAFLTLAALRGYAKSVGAFLAGLPRDVWYGLAIALLLFNSYGHVNRWFFHWEGWKPRAERLQGDLDKIVAAQKQAHDLAHKARLAQEAKSKQKAETTDAHFAETRPLDMALADRFIATHRLRTPAVAGGTGTTGATSQGDGSEGADGPRSTAKLDAGLVAVPEQDVRTCTENTARLVAAHDWALHLND